MVRSFAALAICAYEGESDVYLFYCDSDWRTVTDTVHPSVEEALAQASVEFENIPSILPAP
jgi:hypothetical protein